MEFPSWQAILASSPSASPRPQVGGRLLLGLLVLGIALRLSLLPIGSSFLYNNDFRAFLETGRYAAAGMDVYQHSQRYNYAPALVYPLAVLYRLSAAMASQPADIPHVYHLLLCLLLSAADICAALLLWRLAGWAVAAAWWLCPYTIYMAGWHQQLEPIALALGLAALYRLHRRGPADLGALALLGASIAAKHLLLLLPLWLALRPGPLKGRLLALAVPGAAVAASFLPWWLAGGQWACAWDDIVAYTGTNNAIWYAWLPAGVWRTGIFLTALGCAGWASRRWPLRWQFTLYMAMLPLLASSIAVQYLAASVLAVALCSNVRPWVVWLYGAAAACCGVLYLWGWGQQWYAHWLAVWPWVYAAMALLAAGAVFFFDLMDKK